MADQNRTDLDWDDVRVFMALVRHGSLSAAARTLCVTHATISRRVRALEHTLGTRLVERRPEGYVLTQSGRETLAVAGEMESAAARLVRSGDRAGPHGLVRVSAPPTLAHGVLMRPLAELAARHEALDVHVTTDLRSISLERREADIVVRLGRPVDGMVLARPLGAIGFGFYGTADWARRIEQGQSPSFVGFDEVNASLPEAAWLARQFPRARIAFRANTQLAQADAARAGAGIALLPDFLARGDARLVRCDIEPTHPPREVWLLTRSEDRHHAAMRVVSDCIAGLFSDAGRQDAGTTPPAGSPERP